MPMYEDILVIAEHRNGEPLDVCLELLEEGRRIADELESKLCAVVLGNDVGNITHTLAEHGADKIYAIKNPLLIDYSGELYTNVLSDLIKDIAPKIILCSATSIGSDLAPRLAARLNIGYISDCIDIKLSQNGLLLTKRTHGNKVYTTYTCSSYSQIVTIEPGILSGKNSAIAGKAEIVTIAADVNADTLTVKNVGTIKADQSAMDLSEADIIVAGGKGVGSAANFRLLEELANALGGCVAGTRMAVDAGWISSDRLVGQTGNFVKPKLYIACGISGAPHHTLGMKDSKRIVAINLDADAPMFKVADVGIVGNLSDIIPTMITQLHKVKALE